MERWQEPGWWHVVDSGRKRTVDIGVKLVQIRATECKGTQHTPIGRSGGRVPAVDRKRVFPLLSLTTRGACMERC